MRFNAMSVFASRRSFGFQFLGYALEAEPFRAAFAVGKFPVSPLGPCRMHVDVLWMHVLPRPW